MALICQLSPVWSLMPRICIPGDRQETVAGHLSVQIQARRVRCPRFAPGRGLYYWVNRWPHGARVTQASHGHSLPRTQGGGPRNVTCSYRLAGRLVTTLKVTLLFPSTLQTSLQLTSLVTLYNYGIPVETSPKNPDLTEIGIAPIKRLHHCCFIPL